MAIIKSTPNITLIVATRNSAIRQPSYVIWGHNATICVIFSLFCIHLKTHLLITFVHHIRLAHSSFLIAVCSLSGEPTWECCVEM